jgi:hypothetical protein
MQRTILRSFSTLGLALACSTGCPAGDDTETGADTGTGDTTATGGNPTSNTMSATTPDTTVDTTTPDPDTTIGTDTTTDTAGGTAQVRVVHASPGAGNVDVYAMGSTEPLVADLAYGAATAYVEVPAGDYVFEIRPAGAAPEDAPLYSSDTVTVAPDTLSTAVAAGVVGAKDEASAFRILALTDAFEAPAAGTARVRILHAGADAPDVDVDVGNDGMPEIEGLARFTATDAAGVELPADAPLSVGVWAAGERITQFSIPGLPDGATILVAATGLVVSLPREETGFGLLPVLTEAALPIIRQDPRVYALHAFSAAAAAEVDVCFEGTVLVDGLTWADPTTSLGSFQVAPGDYDVTLQANADDCAGTDLVGPVATGALAAGEQYLATVGATAAGEPQLIVATEEFSLDLAPQAAIYAVHAAELGTVAAGLVDENGEIANPLIINRGNGAVVGELPLDAGTYYLGLTTQTVDPPFASLGAADVTIVGGERLWLVVAGNGASVGAGNADDLRYRVVDTSGHPAPWTVADLLLVEP